MDDEAIRADLLQRGKPAFESVVEAYGPRLLAFAITLTRSREDGEEVVQDAFLRAFRAIFYRMAPGRVAALQLSPWLYRITRNVARNHQRARRRRAWRIPFSLDQQPGRLRGYDAAPEPEVAEDGTLLAELGRMPARYGEPLALRFLEGLSNRDIARVMDLPEATVRTRLHRGLALLRQRLTQDGEVEAR